MMTSPTHNNGVVSEKNSPILTSKIIEKGSNPSEINVQQYSAMIGDDSRANLSHSKYQNLNDHSVISAMTGNTMRSR